MKNRKVTNMAYDMINTDTHTSISEGPKVITDMGWEGLKDHVFPCLTSTEDVCQVKGGLAHSSFLDLHIHY